MKKNYITAIRGWCLAMAAMAGLSAATAQSNSSMMIMDANNLRVHIPVAGDLFNDPMNYRGFEAPKGSNKVAMGASSLWIGGLDGQGNLHLGAMTYRQSGSDFYAGPVNTRDVETPADVSARWDRVWQVTREEIETFRSGGTMSLSIKEWPGNAESAHYASNMAPYVDVDNDGIYDPAKGDYPDIKGDAMCWWVFNDVAGAHQETGGMKLGVEIHGKAWMYADSSKWALYNTVFVQYEIYNRSPNNYDSVFIGLFTDFDLGNAMDDYVGADTERNGVYVYNSNAVDAGAMGYGDHIPVGSLLFLDNELDHYISYNNDFTIQGNPEAAIEYYMYLNSRWKDGKCLTKGGNGYGGTDCTNIMYDGWPNDSTGWTEGLSGNKGRDVRAVPSTGPFSFEAGGKKTFTVAYTYSQGPGSTKENLDLMRKQMDEITNFYKNGNSGTGAEREELANKVKLYPNPATDVLRLEYEGLQLRGIRLTDVAGRTMMMNNHIMNNTGSNSMAISLEQVPAGLYLLTLETDKGPAVKRLVVNR